MLFPDSFKPALENYSFLFVTGSKAFAAHPGKQKKENLIF